MWSARGGVFGKQARLVFAEFLLSLLIYPYRHTSVGLTVIIVSGFLVVILVGQYPLGLGPGMGRWAVRFDIHLCGEGGASLITHISMVSSIAVWRGPVEGGA